MKGRFYKDLLNLKTHFFYYALEIAVFAAVSYFMENVYFFCGLMIFLSVSATISNMQCDEVDGFEKFAVLSGISKKKLVGESIFSPRLHCLFPPFWARR